MTVVKIVINNLAVSTDGANNDGVSQVCVRYHLATTDDNTGSLSDTAPILFYTLETGKITCVFDAT